MKVCYAAAWLFVGVIALFINPIVGVICILMAASVVVQEAWNKETKTCYPEWKRTVNFGPNGPPWAENEPPLAIASQAVFPSSVAKLHEEGPKPPDLEIDGGVTRPIAGTERPETLWITLHSGEELKVSGIAGDRLREWFELLGVQKEEF